MSRFNLYPQLTVAPSSDDTVLMYDRSDDNLKQVPFANFVNIITGGLQLAGSWDANTNTPTITSGEGVEGVYYIVDNAGSTLIDGIDTWVPQDFILFDGTQWIRITNVNEATEISAIEAEHWANYPVDSLVPEGDGVDDYSSLHHRIKAEEAEAKVAPYYSDIDTVSNNITSVVTVSSDIANVNTTATDIANVNTTATNITDVNAVAADIGNVNIVAPSIANVNTVATDITNVNNVGSNITNVNTVASNDANITTVANDLNEAVSEINTVAGSIDNVDLTGQSITNVNTVATDITNVNTTATNIADVNTVATDITNVNTTATNISDVNITANNIADINTVANDLNEAVSEINTVAGSIANVDLTGQSITSVNTVATDITNVNTTATNIADVNTVAGSITNVNNVGTDIANVNTTATNIANVNTVATDLNLVTSNVETVAGSITNVNNVGNDITNVNTVATDISNVNTTATNISDVNITATNILDINTVADDLNLTTSNIKVVAIDINSVNTTATNILDVNTTANNITNVNTVATDITNVNTTATNIADVNTVATNIIDIQNAEENALESKNWANYPVDSLVPEGDGIDDYSALHHATKASASASAAATSESDAAASAQAAAASYDSFDDRYLGAKATDPTTDNDGDPLVVGALYFNSELTEMKVWNGASWDSAALYVEDNLTSTSATAALSANQGRVLDEAQAAHESATGTNVHGLGTASTADVTTSSTDTTVGRLLKVGDFGVGSWDTSRDLSSQVQTTDYRKSVIALCELTNAVPYFNSWSSGSISFHRVNSINAEIKADIQIAKIYNTTTPRAELRRNTSFTPRVCTFTYNGVKYGGIEFFHSAAAHDTVIWNGIGNFTPFGLDYYNTDTATVINTEVNNSLNFTEGVVEQGNYYHTGNILGTVSQSAGVPTGAIIERGSGTGGTWIKYADGKLEIFGSASLGSILTVGSGTDADPYAVTGTIIFPISFTTVAACIVAPELDVVGTGVRAITASYQTVSTTSINNATVYRTSSSNTDGTVIFNYHAIGTWY